MQVKCNVYLLVEEFLHNCKYFVNLFWLVALKAINCFGKKHDSGQAMFSVEWRSEVGVQGGGCSGGGEVAAVALPIDRPLPPPPSPFPAACSSATGPGSVIAVFGVFPMFGAAIKQQNFQDVVVT